MEGKTYTPVLQEALSLDSLRNVCEDWFVIRKQYHIRILYHPDPLLRWVSRKFKRMNESCSHVFSFKQLQKREKKPVEELVFSSLLHVLSLLEEQKGSVFLLGGNTRQCNTVYTNCKHTFPRLNILGRHPGVGSGQQNSNVLRALQKMRPALLLLGSNMKDGDIWLYEHRDVLPPSVCLWLSGCFLRMAQSE